MRITNLELRLPGMVGELRLEKADGEGNGTFVVVVDVDAGGYGLGEFGDELGEAVAVDDELDRVFFEFFLCHCTIAITI